MYTVTTVYIIGSMHCASEFHQAVSESLNVEGPDPLRVTATLAIAILEDH